MRVSQVGTVTQTVISEDRADDEVRRSGVDECEKAREVDLERAYLMMTDRCGGQGTG